MFNHCISCQNLATMQTTVELKLQKYFDRNLRTKYSVNVCFLTGLSNQGWANVIFTNTFELAPVSTVGWPLTFVLFVFVFAAASCWWSADAATRPCCQPDSHDAGHHGPEFVLLQCKTDDWEGPTCALKILDYSDSGGKNMDEPMRSEEAETEAVCSGLHFSHLTVIITLIQWITGINCEFCQCSKSVQIRLNNMISILMPF